MKRPLRVLGLSSVFPNPKQPLLGVFVRERLARVARSCDVQVVAPYPWFPLNAVIRGPHWAGIPPVERQGNLRVHHPRFLSVPRWLKTLDGALYAASLLPFLVRLRREFPFEVIDANFAYPDGTAAVLLGKFLGCPVTITLRGTIVPLSRFRLRRLQIRWTLRNAARVFSVSHALKGLAVSLGVSGDNIRVIPNGVDQAFRPGLRAEARSALGLPLDRGLVLSVGTLSVRKGQQRVLEALPEVVAKRPDVLYVVVGGPSVEGDTGPLLARLIAEHRLQHHVRLVGARPHEEIPRWLGAADLLCLASSNEGRANVIIESLSCGVPVVASDIPGNAELVHGGSDGLLVPLGDTRALSRALLQGLETDWDRESIASRAGGRSWDDAASEVLEELRTVLAERAGVPRAPLVSHS